MQPNLFRTKRLAKSNWNWKQNRNHGFICTVFVSNFSFFVTDRDTLCSTLTMAAYQQLCFPLVYPASAEAAKKQVGALGTAHT